MQFFNNFFLLKKLSSLRICTDLSDFSDFSDLSDLSDFSDLSDLYGLVWICTEGLLIKFGGGQAARAALNKTFGRGKIFFSVLICTLFPGVGQAASERSETEPPDPEKLLRTAPSAVASGIPRIFLYKKGNPFGLPEFLQKKWWWGMVTPAVSNFAQKLL